MPRFPEVIHYLKLQSGRLSNFILTKKSMKFHQLTSYLRGFFVVMQAKKCNLKEK